jgi:hypothetical protein
LVVLGLVGLVALACGPDQRPQEGCDGPTFNLVVRAENGPLPSDTRINVIYGSNQMGEPYELGQPARKQAVFCDEDTTVGGASGDGDGDGDGHGGQAKANGGAGGDGGVERAPRPRPAAQVQALRCRLYTQGPARVDVTATGYEKVKDYNLPFIEDEPHCRVDAEVMLTPLPPKPVD